MDGVDVGGERQAVGAAWLGTARHSDVDVQDVNVVLEHMARKASGKATAGTWNSAPAPGKDGRSRAQPRIWAQVEEVQAYRAGTLAADMRYVRAVD